MWDSLVYQSGWKTAAWAEAAWLSLLSIFEGNGLKTSQCGHLGRLKERASTLVLDGQEIYWDMPCWSALGQALRSPLPTCEAAQFCRYSGTDIVKAWSAICFSWRAKRHWKHGLCPQKGVGCFFAFEVAKCKEWSMHFTQCQLQQPSVWGGWLPSRTEERLISSHHKQPQNGTVLTWLSFTTSHTKTGDLILNIAEIREKVFLAKYQESELLTQVSRPYSDWHNSFKGTLQRLCQQSPDT